ncbi:MAG: VWA domain-containing protein [Verrucomicrobia bacterium]|nr:MAG: VWA domain-containing protein [Verrucomicrobiota bacterium]
MKTNRSILLGTALALAVVSLVSAKDAETKQAKSAKPRLEVCFVLDTTGSMSGLIEGAKQKIWSIANEMISAKPTPEIKLGLIGYRDRGDDYVVKTYDLTNDIDAVYANLRAFSAGGGGDTPESVNEALNAAVSDMKWSQDRSVLKIIFLVGDAPPHMDYANGPKYPDVCQAAMKKDLIINTVQCGNMSETTPVWKEIAKLSEGSYVAIEQSGGMIAIETPMDAKLAELNRKVGATLVGYGGVSVRREIAAKQLASEAAPASVSADRLKFNYASGKTVQGEGELLDSLAAGTLKLDAVKKDQLPADWQKLDDKELKLKIESKQKERAELQAQIVKLNKERDEYIAAERKKLEARGSADSFDAKVAAAIRAEAARKGIEYGTK